MSAHHPHPVVPARVFNQLTRSALTILGLREAFVEGFSSAPQIRTRLKTKNGVLPCRTPEPRRPINRTMSCRCVLGMPIKDFARAGLFIAV
jgi:hypothetical protein